MCCSMDFVQKKGHDWKPEVEKTPPGLALGRYGNEKETLSGNFMPIDCQVKVF